MKPSILIFFILFLFSCNRQTEQPKEAEIRSINQPMKNESILKENVLYKGDTSAYYELSVAFLDHAFQEEFLIYAMMMANKYDYPQAYFDVYLSFKNAYDEKKSEIDMQSANLAIEYLLKASEKGHHQAKEVVKEYSVTRNQNNKAVIERISKEERN